MVKYMWAVIVAISLVVSLVYAGEFDPYGASRDSYVRDQQRSYWEQQEANRRALEQNQETQRYYQESNRQYLETPSYENNSTWISRPNGKVSQCLPNFFNSKVVDCY
jgi:hypothetical protein